MILTGGADKCAVVFDRNTQKIVTTLKGHQKRVNGVIFHPTEVRYLHKYFVYNLFVVAGVRHMFGRQLGARVVGAG